MGIFIIFVITIFLLVLLSDAFDDKQAEKEEKNIEFAADTEKFRKDKISEFLNN